jgi:hypothetical protein
MSLDIATGIVRMHTQTWFQRLHTGRASYLQCWGSIEPDSHFIMAGGYKMHEFSCELALLKGDVNERDKDILKHGIGIIDLHKGATVEEADFIAGWCYIADELYYEVWESLANSDHLSAIVELHVGPVKFTNGFDNVIWDKAKQKELFIFEVGISFTKMVLPSNVSKRRFGFRRQ